MDLIKELDKCFQRDGAAGILPQALPPEILAAVIMIAEPIFMDRDELIDPQHPYWHMFRMVQGALWKASQWYDPNRIPEDRLIHFCYALRVEDFVRQKIVVLNSSWTFDNVFEPVAPLVEDIDYKKYAKYANANLNKILGARGRKN